MKVLLIIVGLLIAATGIVLMFVGSSARRNRGRKAAGSVLILVAGLALFIVACSFEVIPTGYVGIKTHLGQVSDTPVPVGVAWHVPFIESIEKVCVKQQTVTSETRIWGESEDKTPVYAENIVVAYRIDSAKVVDLYKNIASTNYMTGALVSTALKSAMVELPTEEVTIRSKIEPLVLEKLNEVLVTKYGEGSIIAEQVTVTQMDFEDSYNEAIAQKSIAKQVQERQSIENETAVKKAEADKKVAIAQAEAEAEAAKIKAEADAAVAKIKADSNAEVMRIPAEAEAEANKKVAESLDENILKAKFYESWDGKLPSVMGEGTVITDISN